MRRASADPATSPLEPAVTVGRSPRASGTGARRRPRRGLKGEDVGARRADRGTRIPQGLVGGFERVDSASSATDSIAFGLPVETTTTAPCTPSAAHTAGASTRATVGAGISTVAPRPSHATSRPASGVSSRVAVRNSTVAAIVACTHIAISRSGTKKRRRASPPSRAGSTNAVSNPNSAAIACICASLKASPSKTTGHGLPPPSPSGKTVGPDDVHGTRSISRAFAIAAASSRSRSSVGMCRRAATRARCPSSAPAARSAGRPRPGCAGARALVHDQADAGALGDGGDDPLLLGLDARDRRPRRLAVDVAADVGPGARAVLLRPPHERLVEEVLAAHGRAPRQPVALAEHADHRLAARAAAPPERGRRAAGARSRRRCRPACSCCTWIIVFPTASSSSTSG